MTSPRLSLYDRNGLRDYFKAEVEKPKWRPWLGTIGEIPDDVGMTVKGVEVKVTGLRNAFRKWTLDSRVKYASYYWYFPFEDGEHSTLESGVPYVQAKSGLSHLTRREFVDQLKNEATRLEQDHPRLASWIRFRSALLEFEEPVDRPHQLREVELVLRNELFRIVGVWFDPSAAPEALDDLIAKALRAAAQAVHAVLGGSSGGRLTASIMLPARNPSHALAFLRRVGLPVDTAAQRSQELWSDLPEKDREACLVIVAEAVVQDSPRHVGFWVPLARGNGGAKLPGAPEAYSNLVGSTVFCHDVPPLKGFGDELSLKWKTHITSHVRGRHFVSVPFVVSDASGGDFAAAIVNVNADPGEGDEWFRALHKNWLQRATDAAAPFAEVAFHAIRARFAGPAPGVASVGLLDTLPAAWRPLIPGSTGGSQASPSLPPARTEGASDE